MILIRKEYTYTTGTPGAVQDTINYSYGNACWTDLKHERGVLSMARAMDPDSAGSQFFIMHETSPHLDGQYAAFGKVIEGMDVVDRIANVRTDYSDKPLIPQVIEIMTVQL